MNFQIKTLELEKRKDLGAELYRWSVKPKTSSKTIAIIISILAVLFYLGVSAGDRLLPHIKHVKDVPFYLLYVLPFILAPITNWFKKRGKEQEYILYKSALFFSLKEKDKVIQDRTWKWKDFTRCDYYSDHLKLSFNNPLMPRLKLLTPQNGMSIYMMCRERISITTAAGMSSKFDAPEAPDTAVQRRIRRLQKHSLEVKMHGPKNRGFRS